MRDISDLVAKQKAPAAELTIEELNRKMYLEDVERLKDFRLPGERTRWPTPVRPRWKN